MAHTALNDDEIKEYFDDDATVTKNVKLVAEAIKANPGGLVIYTGAGVSTSCGISDFRGPSGVWTRQSQIQQGKKIEQPSRVIQSSETQPSPTHMAIVALQNANYLSKLISTNCDGLHIRSGVRPEKILELHGNCNVEACPNCGKCYYRDFPVDLEGFDRSRAIITGRRCDFCQSLLRRTDVAFGQSLPDLALGAAEYFSSSAKVVLVLGTSLRVRPACELPFLSRKAISCIVNLQKTPYDRTSKVRIFTPTDNFIEKLMAELQLSIPQFVEQTRENDSHWMQEFDQHYQFRSAPDSSWFDSEDDDVALRFLEEQKRGIGVKMVTDSFGQVHMERYVVGDQDEPMDDDLDGFEIYPKKNCPHVNQIELPRILCGIPENVIVHGCEKCNEPEENWVCLYCMKILCGRAKNQHMLIHATEEQSSHVLCASLMDLSFWCYGCNSYVTSPNLTPIFDLLHQFKFNESALPIHDIM